MEKNREKPNSTPSQEVLLLSGPKGLIVAMLRLMMKDLTISDSEIQVSPYDSREVMKRKKKKKYYKRTAYRFVRSEWFEDLRWGIGINPHPIRRYAIQCYMEAKKK